MKVPLPENLTSYQQKAEQALREGAVKDVEFSGPTYQVLVEDPDTHVDFWVFLQLNGHGEIKDGFCSCDHLQEVVGCVHLAIAFLSLFKEFDQPLHQRFQRSLWNSLCRIYEERLGGNPDDLFQEGPGKFSATSSNGRIIFLLEAKNEQASSFLKDMIHVPLQQTEETSLKFSNLSPEDISLWKQGTPRPQLRYDLSYWSDLAKCLMKKQEEGNPYQVSFRYSKKGLPNWIQVDFDDIRVGFYLSLAILPLIIESLETVSSPLKVSHRNRSVIDRVTYDKHDQVMNIVEKQGTALEGLWPEEEAIQVGEWSFIRGKGFYTEEPHELLKHPALHGIEIPQTLSEHSRLISSLIIDSQVYLEPVSLSYHIQFDEEWCLHILAYLFNPGDLSEGDSWLMGDWAYLDDDGFYPVKGNQFDSIEMNVSLVQVSDFVTKHRVWFDHQEGFQTHVRSIEYQLSYQVNENNRLTFVRSLENTAESGSKIQDFGVWVYLEGHGFYSKASGSFSYLLRPGISLAKEQVPLFIKMNREELQLIPKFFTDICPIKHTGINIELIDDRKIEIYPAYQINPEFKGRIIRQFDDFVYMEGEGFYEIPPSLRLPEKFRQPVELEKDELVSFLTSEIDTISHYIQTIDPRLVKPSECQLVAHSIEAIPERGRGWYRFFLEYETELGTIPCTAIVRSLKNKIPFMFHEAGLLDLRNPRFDWLRRLGKDRIIPSQNALLLTALDFMRVHAFDPITLRGEGGAILDELLQLRTPQQPNIEGLLSHLRPYQQNGVQWLWFLYQQQLSGLLCDDMGLGKTHQAMALIASISNLFRTFAEGTAHHYLIVCPTSVIYHWQEKLLQYLPGMRVCTFFGSKRSLDQFSQHYDILLTSYGILRNEREALSKVPFELAVFDEIQIAKNPTSKIYAALTLIKAQMRIGLTGTPIENRLRELKSLFDLTLPSYFPGDREFRNTFVRPIEKDQNQERKQLLSRLIHPFILRRKKEDVLKDLPEKTEEVAHCDLSPVQQILYSEVLMRRRSSLMQELRNEQNTVPYMHIFALLSSLKQICDHPAVYLKSPGDYKMYHSGKWELFIELLREARESRQKVVVFSQYLAMLDIIEGYLQEEGIRFASLRGATINRKEEIFLFNHDPECEVFVGSLHAAGLGIDLTAGSVVIHYDRWWNAARENQATDRVHRIGQLRGVQVFKLVTKGTFEERIDTMIARKGKLMEEVVGVDDQHILKTFSRSELIELLELVDTSVEHPEVSDTDED